MTSTEGKPTYVVRFEFEAFEGDGLRKIQLQKAFDS